MAFATRFQPRDQSDDGSESIAEGKASQVRDAYIVSPLTRAEVMQKLIFVMRELVASIHINFERTSESSDIFAVGHLTLAFSAPGSDVIYSARGIPQAYSVEQRLHYGPSLLRFLLIVRELVHLVRSGDFATQREIYYALKRWFRNQRQCDYTIRMVSTMLKTFRVCLGVVAASRGSFAGRVRFRDGIQSSWTLAMSAGEHFVQVPVTPAALSLSECSNLHFRATEWPAICILVVEKDAVFQRLVQARFYEMYPCIIVTGRGMPSLATRAFVKRLHDRLQIPVFILVDYNPYGLRIACTYMSGSDSSPESYTYAVPSARVVGITTAHIRQGIIAASIREECYQPFRPSDVSCVQSLASNVFLQRFRPHLIDEAQSMLQMQKTLEIEALYSTSGVCHFIRSWLPEELTKARTRWDLDSAF